MHGTIFRAVKKGQEFALEFNLLNESIKAFFGMSYNFDPSLSLHNALGLHFVTVEIPL